MSDSIVIEESNGEVIIIEPTVVINQGGNSAWGEIAGDIGDQSDLVAEFDKKMDVEPTVLPPNTDINTVVGNGVYVFDYTATNRPSSGSGLLVVNQSGDNISQTVYIGTQIYNRNTDELYVLFDYPWVQYADTDALNTKVDKIPGKGLSTNDYTTTEKNKLAGIEAGAQVNVIPTWNSVTDKPETFPPAAHTHSGMVTSSTVAEIVTLTQSAYDALDPKVPTTLYIIAGA